MLTDNGLVVKRFTDIESEINEKLLGTISNQLDLSPDSFLGVFKDIYALHESYLWELLQDVYDSSNLLSAEDYLLENLALMVGAIKQPATRTRGQCYLTYDEGYQVFSGDEITSVTGDTFLVEEDGLITSRNCVKTYFKLNALVQFEDYSIAIDDNIYKRLHTTNQTTEEIITDLNTLLQADGSITTTVVLDGDDSYIIIDKVDKSQNMIVSSGSYVTFFNVTTPFLVIAEEFGLVYAKAGTLNTFVRNSSVTCTNPTDLTVGSNKESDSSLRRKILNRFFNNSDGSLQGIYDAFNEIPGVTSVKILENPDYSPTATLPPNSYKIIVFGGDEELIGETVWETTPAGIQPYAPLNDTRTVSVEITDFNGQNHIVYFERPDIKYIWIYVEYTKYSEESFPDSGEDIMKDELALFGQALTIGEDVFPDRFYSSVYKSVSGVGNLELYFAVTDDLNTTPTYPADYSQAVIPISDEELTNFSSTRVTVVEV